MSFYADRATRAPDAEWFLLAGMVLDPSGNLYLADSAKRRVCQVTWDGIALTVAGPPDLLAPMGLAVGSAGRLFIADAERNRVLRVDPDGHITTAAGVGAAGFSGDGGAAPAAQLNEPWGLAADSAGSLFIADAGNHCIRRVASDGTINTVAGVGTAGFSGDGGAAVDAKLDRPISVAADSQGNLFIVDSLNGRVRKIGTDGVITTVFGGSGAQHEDVSGAARYHPAGVAVDREGCLLIVDPFHHGIFRVSGQAAPGLIAGRLFPDLATSQSAR